jgi:hypothetical protein
VIEGSIVIFRATLTWILLSVVAILNGFLRNYLLTPNLGEDSGHIISTIILCILIFFVTWALIKWIDPKSCTDARVIGICWVILTLAFEFLAGHYLFGHPWSRLIADYNMARGRFWVLVLIATYFAPIYSARIRRIC